MKVPAAASLDDASHLTTCSTANSAHVMRNTETDNATKCLFVKAAVVCLAHCTIVHMLTCCQRISATDRHSVHSKQQRNAVEKIAYVPSNYIVYPHTNQYDHSET